LGLLGPERRRQVHYHVDIQQNEPLTVQPQDDNGFFRIVDCKYMYNLATSSLSGAGTYNVFATNDECMASAHR
jgi:hypothetical protein